MTGQTRSTPDRGFEREKWENDVRLREREITLKERTQDAAERETLVKLAELKRSRWSSPLVLAVLAAAVAATGNASVALINGVLQRDLERQRASVQYNFENAKADSETEIEEAKAESARILEMIKTNDPDKAAVNLAFLLETGLIVNEDRRNSLRLYLENRIRGQGPTLPSPAVDSRQSSSLKMNCKIPDFKADEVEASIRTILSSFSGGKYKVTEDDGDIWIDDLVGGYYGFRIWADESEQGFVEVTIGAAAPRKRSDEEAINDKATPTDELIPALVRRKLRELAADPSCAA